MFYYIFLFSLKTYELYVIFISVSNIHFVHTAVGTKNVYKLLVILYYNLNKICLSAFLTKFIKHKKNYVFIILANFFSTRMMEDVIPTDVQQLSWFICVVQYIFPVDYMTNSNLTISKYIFKHPSMIIYSIFSVYYKNILCMYKSQHVQSQNMVKLIFILSKNCLSFKI